MSTVLPLDEEVQALRRALRSGDRRAQDRAVEPLLQALSNVLLGQARRLVSSSWRPLGLEGEDLVQDAWVRALRYLLEPAGEAVQTYDHLRRLLSRMIKQRFLDAIDRAEGRGEEELEDQTVETVADGNNDLGEGVLWLEDGKRQAVIGALFESDAAFLAACGQKPRRRRRHYQAYVLFVLARFYRDEVLSQRAAAELFARYVSLLGVASEDWEALEQVVAGPGTSESELFTAVNALCGTTLTDRGTLYSLRYELGQLAGER